MNQENDTSVKTEYLSNRIKSCWSFGNPYSLRFLDDPPTDPPSDPPADPPSDPPASLVNTDGTFVKDWTTKLENTALHNDPTLIRYKGINELSDGHVNLRRQVPMDKMPRPTEHFTDADWSEFYKAGGRPDTAADYGMTRPEGMPEELLPQEVIEKWQNLFHKYGASKGLVDAANALNLELYSEAKKNIDQRKEMDFNTLKNGLMDKWGLAYEQKVHLGNIAIDKGCIKSKDGKNDLDAKERLERKINADPDLIEFASNLGSLFAEHKINIDPNIPTPADMDTQIRDAQNHPAYMDKRNPDHARQVQLVAHLIQEKTKHLEKVAV